MSGLQDYEEQGAGENFTLSACNGMFFYLEVFYISTL